MIMGALLLVTALATLSTGPATARGGGLEVLGELAIPKLGPDEDPLLAQSSLATLDAENRRLYLFITRHVPAQNSTYLMEYDVSTDIPTFLRMSDAPVTNAGVLSPYTAVIDSRRNRLVITSFTKETGGNRPVVELIDLKTLSRVGEWELATAAPGFVGMGLTYDVVADRFYLVGEFAVNSAADILGRLPGRAQGPVPSVLALDGETGSVQWVRPLPGCRSVLRSAVGAFIGRSARRPVLYTFCDSGGVALNQFLTGQNALVRVTIADDAGAQQALEFPVEFFPVSGQYIAVNQNEAGIVGFDPVAERVFAQSLSVRTAGGWVFDGLRSAWVGFVGAPDKRDFYLGVNPANGRYYLAGYQTGSQDGYINVTDGRSTPVAQGTTFTGLKPLGFLATDTKSNRLFGMFDKVIEEGDPETGIGRVTQLVPVVLRDTTPSIQPLAATDYDVLTADLPDDQASLDYSSGASGFGARYELVGGVEGGSGRIGSGEIVNPIGLAVGDRGTALAAVPRVDIRPAGASATAAAATVDDATESDRSGVAGQIESAGAPSEALTFPYGTTTCLDGNGERIEQSEGAEGDIGRATVVCDLKRLESSGTAAFSERVGAGGVSVAAGAFETRSRRDAKRGVMTQTTAIAEGIALRSPAGPRVVIDRIVTTATTSANGRPGTATASWERLVEGVTIVDADGTASPAQSCTSVVTGKAKAQRSGDCDELARQINRVLPTEMRVRFPLPQVTTSPRGAFAAVQEPENEYLDGLTTSNDDDGGIVGMEAVVFNDGAEKSRLLVQLASIRADAIFTRSALPSFDDGQAGAGGAAEGTGTAGGAGRDLDSGEPSSGEGNLAGGGEAPLPPIPVVAGGGAAATGLAAPGITGWLIGARGARDAVLAGGVWLLFATALAAAWRRRRLIETMGG